MNQDHYLIRTKTLFHDPTTHKVADNILNLLRQHAQLFEQITDELDSLKEINSYFVLRQAMIEDIETACLYGEDYF